MSLKILQINSVVNYGSTGRIVEDIGQSILIRGWESYIAYGRYPRNSKSKLIKIGNRLEQLNHGFKTRMFDKHCFESVKSTYKLIDQVIKLNPDLIHLHNLHGYYLNIEILFKYLSSIEIPVIWTLHDCWPFTGHCAYFDSIGCLKWESGCFQCPQKSSYPASYICDRSSKNYNIKKELFTSVKKLTLVPVSKWLAKLLAHSFLKDFPIRIINNGIDLENFNPDKKQVIRNKYNLSEKFILLGVASVWDQRKGFQDFIKLSQLLDSDCQIILLGVNKKQLKILPENIIGIEKTESVNELAKFYSTANVFLNPTYQDNFPTTNLEALACGTPVITYKTGGSPESIDDKTGIIVDKGDISGLFLAIQEIKNIGKEYYSHACLNRANQYYNKDDRYQEYIDLYNKVLSKK